MTDQQWDIGSPEPGPAILAVESIHFDDIDDHDSGVPLTFGRTHNGEWKGYLFGGKTYYGWEELTRRFGPLQESKR